MSEDYTEKFLEVLNNTFITCDKNGTGFVEINKLVDFLISQEPSWLEDEIREEFHKVLNGDLNYVISKEDFMKSLLGWFKSSSCTDKDGNIEENDIIGAGKYSSSTSGIGEPSEITSASSASSIEGVYSGTNFVSDEQTYTNEDCTDDISLNDSGSSQVDSRSVIALQSEISMLFRKNEYLENTNYLLLGQISSLEETLAKKSEESEDYKKQLIKTKDHLEIQFHKNEDSEERINKFMEENKSMTIQLCQSEKENSKLKIMVSDLEKKLDNSLNDNTQNNIKLEEMRNKIDTINGLYNTSLEVLEQEREQHKFKEKERENAWIEVIEENQNLHSQLASSTSYTKDIKSKLRDALKELSEIKSAKIKRVMKIDSSSSLFSVDNSMDLIDENFSVDSTIPFETSLLAELKDEVQSDKQECCCVRKQSVTLIPKSSDTTDAAVGTQAIETMEKATMTTFYESGKCSLCSNVEHKDVGVECSFKEMYNVFADSKSSLLCLLKSRRSFKKWMSLLAVLIILCFFLVFFSFQVFLLPNFKHSHKPMFSFTTFFDVLQVQVKNLEVILPIK